MHNYIRQFPVVHPRLEVMSQVVFEALHLDAKGEPAFRMHDVQRTFTG